MIINAVGMVLVVLMMSVLVTTIGELVFPMILVIVLIVFVLMNWHGWTNLMWRERFINMQNVPVVVFVHVIPVNVFVLQIMKVWHVNVCHVLMVALDRELVNISKIYGIHQHGMNIQIILDLTKRG